MTKSQALGTVAFLMVAMACFTAYVRHETTHITIGNTDFLMVGLATQNMNGEQMYLPVYRKVTK